MRAVVLAGGRGTRLDPLTRDTPKPMIPLFDIPVIEHQLDWLARNGFRDVTVSLGHLGHLIASAHYERRSGMRIRFVSEERPLGTAGAVSWALRTIGGKEPFMVVPGDCVADYDLRAAYQYFQQRGSDLGMVLSRVEDPRPFGVVLTNRNNQVEGLIEKPASLEYGNVVNTGIYYLTPRALNTVIPGSSKDFARDLFPEWIGHGLPIEGYHAQGYWSDIGSLAQYRQTHFDYMAGRVRLPMAQPVLGKLQIDSSARILGPVWLGSHVMIEAQATVGPYAVVGHGSRIGAWSKVDHTIIGPKAVIGAECRIQQAILAEGVGIDGRSQVSPGAVLGTRCQVGWAGRVPADAHVDPMARVAPGGSWNAGIWTHELREARA